MIVRILWFIHVYINTVFTEEIMSSLWLFWVFKVNRAYNFTRTQTLTLNFRKT